MLYLGTTNPYKVQEIAAMTLHLGIRLIPISPFDVAEPYDTFRDNARVKALAYAAATGGATLAEDSGISARALGGLPGPWSARFDDHTGVDAEKGVKGGGLTEYHESGRPRDELDAANMDRLLREMHGRSDRAGEFHVAVCVARGSRILFEAECTTTGSISEEKRGTGGFGYDPVFVGDDCDGATYAELDSYRKNLRSFRRKVLKQLGHWLAGQLRDGRL